MPESCSILYDGESEVDCSNQFHDPARHPHRTMIDYDAHDWRSHLLDIRGSMVREIVWRVMTCVLWSAGGVLIQRYVVRISRTLVAAREGVRSPIICSPRSPPTWSN